MFTYKYRYRQFKYEFEHFTSISSYHKVLEYSVYQGITYLSIISSTGLIF